MNENGERNKGAIGNLIWKSEDKSCSHSSLVEADRSDIDGSGSTAV